MEGNLELDIKNHTSSDELISIYEYKSCNQFLCLLKSI